jgi:hypothetical protein
MPTNFVQLTKFVQPKVTKIVMRQGFLAKNRGFDIRVLSIPYGNELARRLQYTGQKQAVPDKQYLPF